MLYKKCPKSPKNQRKNFFTVLIEIQMKRWYNYKNHKCNGKLNEGRQLYEKYGKVRIL